MDLMEIKSSKLAQPVTYVFFTWKVLGLFLAGTHTIQSCCRFPHLSKQMLGQYLKLDCHFLMHPFQFNIHYHVFNRHYRLLIYWVSLN